MRFNPQRIRDAQTLLARHFGPTRIARAASLSSPGHDVFLKLETDLPTGSFKKKAGARGAGLLNPQQERAELIVAGSSSSSSRGAFPARS
jgi:threonine dehydratase